MDAFARLVLARTIGARIAELTMPASFTPASSPPTVR